MGMVRQVVLTVWVCCFALEAAADPRATDNYKSIVDRNPFGLKDPPPAVVTPEPQHTNDAKKEEFYLTGISTIGNPKKPKAYLLAKDTGKKEYDQKFFNLSVGDRQGDLQLKEIDEKGRRVRIVYQGEEKWLSMKDNGVPAPVGPAPGHAVPNVPGVPGQVGIAPPAPGAVPVPLPNPNTGNSYAVPVPQPQPLNGGAATPNASYARRVPRTPTYTNPNPGGNATISDVPPPLSLPR